MNDEQWEARERYATRRMSGAMCGIIIAACAVAAMIVGGAWYLAGEQRAADAAATARDDLAAEQVLMMTTPDTVCIPERLWEDLSKFVSPTPAPHRRPATLGEPPL